MAERLGVEGFRSPATHRVNAWLADLPVSYDCTVPMSDPYEPQPGGCCSPWPFFIGSVVELPYTIPQDHTTFTLLRAAQRRPLGGPARPDRAGGRARAVRLASGSRLSRGPRQGGPVRGVPRRGRRAARAVDGAPPRGRRLVARARRGSARPGHPATPGSPPSATTARSSSGPSRRPRPRRAAATGSEDRTNWSDPDELPCSNRLFGSGRDGRSGGRFDGHVRSLRGI